MGKFSVPRFPGYAFRIFALGTALCFPRAFPAVRAESAATESEKTESAQTESARFATIRYGTETEIAALIESLKNEQSDSLDDELIVLVQTTRNRSILQKVFAFFADRDKTGLEERAIRAIEERDQETNETVIAAVNYLGRLKAGNAVEPLRKLIGTRERRFMVSAIQALGKVSAADQETARDTAEFLSAYYTDEEPPDEYRRDIITAVGETGSSAGISFLTGIVSNTENRVTLRMAALEALSKIGDKEGLPALIFAVSDGDPNVRSSAIAALGPFTGEDVDKAILEAFRDSYYRTRISAAQASRVRRLEAAIPYLKFRCEQDDVPQVRDESIRALGAINNRETDGILAALFEERKNSDAVRIRAAEMLVTNNVEAYIEKVITEMDDAKSRNQTALYNGLLKIVGAAKSDRLESLVRRFLGSGDTIERSFALDMAANNNFRSLVEDIRPLTENRNTSLARKAQLTLDKLSP
ncbi:MAG: HEAT repeat domain-containing protein [Treponema sp.]|jgi:HEAT repeat protein|nr:HEAT repeat domain-containing protein [Treponema sp.]